MKKFLPILLLLSVYIIFVGGITTFKSIQETNKEQKRIQECLKNVEQRKSNQNLLINERAFCETGFAGGDCHQGVSRIVALTIINLIPLVGISIIVALFVWLVSMLLSKKISISYKQKIWITGIISLLAFEVTTNQFAQLTNQATFYQPIFFPLCL